MQLQLPQLWLLDLRPLMQDERWRAFLPELPIERQTRARSCRREEDAARLTGAGFLLQQALLSLNIPVSEQIFRKNDWGKPYLASHAVEFSLTHASYYAACALDASSVGVDLEAPRITLDTSIHRRLRFWKRFPNRSSPTRCFASGPSKRPTPSSLAAAFTFRSILSMQTCMKARQTCIRTAAPFPSACTNIH